MAQQAEQLPTVTARAYAKVNLALAVGPPLGPEAGTHAGFHPICSWFSAIDLYDELTLQRLPEGEASRHEITWAPGAARPSAIDWPIEKDLAVRAHRLLEAETGRSLPVALRMTKRTPVGGGLGGGSSDAAAMLRATGALFDLRLPHDRLVALSRGLGSDVAFFLDPGAPGLAAPPRQAIVSGLGERIERVARVAGGLVLIVPPFGCPTGAVYRAFDGATPAPLREREIRDLVARCTAAGAVDPGAIFNDLRPGAEAVAPGLPDLARRVAGAAGVPVHLTGSGSTLFTLHPTVTEAAHAAAGIAGLGSNLACPVVSRLA